MRLLTSPALYRARVTKRSRVVDDQVAELQRTILYAKPNDGSGYWRVERRGDELVVPLDCEVMDDRMVCTVEEFVDNVKDYSGEYYELDTRELFVESLDSTTIYTRRAKTAEDYFNELHDEVSYSQAREHIKDNSVFGTNPVERKIENLFFTVFVLNCLISAILLSVPSLTQVPPIYSLPVLLTPTFTHLLYALTASKIFMSSCVKFYFLLSYLKSKPLEVYKSRRGQEFVYEEVV